MIQGYSLTETSSLCTFTPPGLDNYGTIGWPVSNVEMKIADLNDETSNGLGAHESGELLVRGQNIMKGYYKNDDATNATITKDKWLRTGDIGYFDENGLFYITDRLNTLINVSAKGRQSTFFVGQLSQMIK